ncbi:MAG: helix-turn-helix domain-containing protein [Pseudomonadota bacterium]
MSTLHDKRDRAALFRQRLSVAIEAADSNQSALARATGVDRSTISQLLRDAGPRLPNAQLVAECASALGVSADWLLGLSESPEQASDLVAAAFTVTEAPRALVDERIFEWHREAEGYKVRHVPAGLPDMLKSDDMLRWEYKPSLGRTTDQAVGASQDRLDWMRSARSDYEIAMPVHDLQAFARGEGYYRAIPLSMREEQLDRLATLHDQLYPRLRMHLFDARKIFSAPVTIFGPLVAVLYLGSNYLAFRDAERVDLMTRHFDRLVREAEIGSREFPQFIRDLREDVRSQATG